VEISYDPAKNERNIRERGLSFERVLDFDLDGAQVVVDDRRDYGEVRYRAFSMLDDRLHVLVFTLRGQAFQVISLRRANKREVKQYGKT